VDKAFAARLKAYWGAMLKQIRHLNWEENEKEIKNKMLAPLEHLFDNHQYCGSWCYAKKAQTDDVLYIADENRPFYNIKKQNKMYKQVKSSISKFQTKELVIDCLHNFDTNVNESLNILVARMCPKFKHFGASNSLHTRVCIVAGIHNIGYENFYVNTLSNLGIIDSNNIDLISSNITRINSTKQQDRKRRKTLEFKRSRLYGKRAKTRTQVYEERVDRERKAGTYGTAIGVLGEEEVEDEANVHNNNPIVPAPTVCQWCSETNHKTWRAKKCKKNSLYLVYKKELDKDRKSYLYRESLRTQINRNDATNPMLCGVISAGKPPPPPPVIVHTNDEKNVANLLLGLVQNNKKSEKEISEKNNFFDTSMERGIVHTTKGPGDMTPKNVSTHSILSNGLHKNIPSIVPVLDVGVNVCKPLDNIPISTAVDEDVKKVFVLS